jgi:hypothetical protein
LFFIIHGFSSFGNKKRTDVRNLSPYADFIKLYALSVQNYNAPVPQALEAQLLLRTDRSLQEALLPPDTVGMPEALAGPDIQIPPYPSEYPDTAFEEQSAFDNIILYNLFSNMEIPFAQTGNIFPRTAAELRLPVGGRLFLRAFLLFPKGCSDQPDP